MKLRNTDTNPYWVQWHCGEELWTISHASLADALGAVGDIVRGEAVTRVRITHGSQPDHVVVLDALIDNMPWQDYKVNFTQSMDCSTIIRSRTSGAAIGLVRSMIDNGREPECMPHGDRRHGEYTDFDASVVEE